MKAKTKKRSSKELMRDLEAAKATLVEVKKDFRLKYGNDASLIFIYESGDLKISCACDIDKFDFK